MAYALNKLVYIYINKFSRFGPISINLSNQLDIDYSNGVVSIKRKADHFDYLLGESISSLNIIAGENGVGKTTLLKTIAELVADSSSGENNYDFEYLLVFQIDEETFYLRNEHGDTGPYPIEIRERGWFAPKHGPVSDDYRRSVIYFSPYLDFNVLEIFHTKDISPIIDLSATNMVNEDIRTSNACEDNQDERYENPLILHRINNIKRQLKFFNEARQCFEFPFSIPSDINICFHRLTYDRDDVSSDYKKVYDLFHSLCSNFFGDDHVISEDNIAKLVFLRNLLSLYFRSITSIKNRSILNKYVSEKLQSAINKVAKSDVQAVIALFESFFAEKDIFDSNIFSELISSFYKKLIKNKFHVSDNYNQVYISTPTDDPLISLYFRMMDTKINSKMRDRFILPHVSSFITFDWPNFSSGEKMFADLFSRIYGVMDKLKNTDRPILLLIDEGEMGFHPKWQLKYVTTLCGFVNQILGKYKIEILLASHSPLVLSDFPKERVHLFKKSNRNKIVKGATMGTLAQNTSELLAHEFFIDSTLIGDLAKKYVNDIITEIRNLTTSSLNPIMEDELIEKIELIDEPVVKKILLEEMGRIFNA
ncbi:AAA family ATPase [Pedobacter jeongneungensis]|uniref:AAA family ATPase n=1 Tax=Pedobacter jeongneungensis TaxID=947309 RepID=UPI0004680B6B|nr:AAA family ATPase [Pedobacter jeongneungensis]